MMSQRLSRAEAGLDRDTLDWELRRLEEFASPRHACLRQPITGRHAGCLLESPDESAAAHSSAGSEEVDRQVLIQVVLRPRKYGCQGIAVNFVPLVNPASLGATLAVMEDTAIIRVATCEFPDHRDSATAM
ncbi:MULTISPECIES: hypothetical protein [unclassified Bradyrhizobium]|uniref:hypothetical protein n=1 Tax=unclassified Bradyrhizobium TaxID=2631580 RepID=UPI00201C2D31|nr:MULTISPECIES: hypothetical protein [unclassified Bradyrhizobium]